MWKDIILNNIKKSVDLENISTRSFLIFLFMFSLGLRLLYMNPGLFHFDSVLLAQAVEKSFEAGLLHGQFHGRYGSVIVNLLAYVPYTIITGIKSAEKTVIFTNMLFASLSVIILFLFLHTLFANKKIPFFASFLFSISPVFLSVTTYGKPHGIEIFFTLTSFFLLSLFHEKDSLSLLAISSFSMAFSVLIRESAIVFVPLYFLFYLHPEIYFKYPFICIRRDNFRLKNISSVIIPFLVVFGMGLHYYLYDVIYGTLFKTETNIVSFAGFFSSKLPYAIKDLYFNLTIIGIILALAGFFILIKRNENKFNVVLFLLWLSTFLYFGNTDAYAPRFLAIISIPFFVFIAIDLDSLHKDSKISSIALLLFLALVLFMQIQPVLDYRHDYSGEKEYALWLKEQVPPDSLIIAMDDYPFINYYANLNTKGHPISNQGENEIWMAEINLLLKNDTPIYIVESGFSYDPEAIFYKEITQNFNLQVVGSHPIEDYHKASISFKRRYDARLFMILPK